MEVGKRHDTRDTADFCSRQLFRNLLATNGEVANLLHGETDVVDFGFNNHVWLPTDVNNWQQQQQQQQQQ